MSGARERVIEAALAVVDAAEPDHNEHARHVAVPTKAFDALERAVRDLQAIDALERAVKETP